MNTMPQQPETQWFASAPRKLGTRAGRSRLIGYVNGLLVIV